MISAKQPLSSFEAVQPLGQAFQAFGRTVAAGERVFELVDAAPQVRDPEQPRRIPTRTPALTFEGVCFAYPAGAGPALEQIGFSVEPGRRIAVVGASGAGKSTLARLALRYWDPARGTILLDGVAIRDYALDDLRSLFTMVAQDTFLFAGTLRSNLLLARPDATEADLAHVLSSAQLTEFVARLPQGIDSRLGEQGLRISGGERQRVAIARALLRDAPILILDEATANLDPLTEWDLLETMLDPTGGRSVLLISHRLVAMDRMDEILVLERGRIVERGTHAALLAAGGQYRRLYEAQSQILALEEVRDG